MHTASRDYVSGNELQMDYESWARHNEQLAQRWRDQAETSIQNSLTAYWAAVQRGESIGEQQQIDMTPAPANAKDRMQCWGACTWMGCRRSATQCPRDHLEPIKNLSSGHTSVQMQLIKRGGLRSNPKIEAKDIDGRIAQLRSATQQDKRVRRSPAGSPGRKLEPGLSPTR